MPNPLDLADQATILVVDDSPDIRNLMVAVLEDDYKVMAANGGEEAIKFALSDTPPDLILLDVMMPGMSGYDVCRQLKENPRSCDIPVFFLSAMAGDGHKAQGLALGAVDYLTKPLVPAIMMARVKGFFIAHPKRR